jgi:hypothetical protein
MKNSGKILARVFCVIKCQIKFPITTLSYSKALIILIWALSISNIEAQKLHVKFGSVTVDRLKKYH